MIDFMEPPYDTFEKLIVEARQKDEQAKKVNEKAKLAKFSAVINGIEEFGEAAFKGKNKEAWVEANKQIEKALQDINYLLYEKIIENIPQEEFDKYAREGADRLKNDLEELLGNIGTQLNRALETTRGANYMRFRPELDKLIKEFSLVASDDPYAVKRTYDKLSDLAKKLAERIRLSGETKM